jgi:hypothetical protein
MAKVYINRWESFMKFINKLYVYDTDEIRSKIPEFADKSDEEIIELIKSNDGDLEGSDVQVYLADDDPAADCANESFDPMDSGAEVFTSADEWCDTKSGFVETGTAGENVQEWLQALPTIQIEE